MISSKELSKITEYGLFILEKMPPMHGGCLYLSAMLVAMINDETELDAKLVTGSLTIEGKTVFSHSQISSLISSGSDVLSSWDGHAWAVISGTVFDLSVFRTIYTNQTPKLIAQLFFKKFGDISFLVGKPNILLREKGLLYTQCEELTDCHVTILINSAYHLRLINN